jgi:RHS repeat-associated protein
VNQTYAYDAAGHTLQAGSTTFVYGANGRLSQAKQGSTVLADYGYDALGRRVTKTVNGQTRYFSFDRDGKLLMDETAYVYLDDLPLVQLDSQGNASYLHPNHLGAPLAATSESGGVVWQADYAPFGQASVVNPSVSVNLRLPGQYFDPETGLHYNVFRDYDPSLGRYIESDPIGLEGGLNTYAYVGGSPVNWIDPLGLCFSGSCHLPPGVSPNDLAYPPSYNSVSPEVEDAINDILKDKTPTDKTSKVKEFSGSGGEDACLDDAKKLPTDGGWITTPDGKIIIPLPGGGTANIHPSSTRGGRPTLDLPNPNATNPKSRLKIRY